MVVIVDLEALLKIGVRIDEFLDFLENNVRLVLFCGRAEDLRVLITGKIAVIGRQDAVQEGLAVLTAQLDVAGTVPAVSA